MKAVLDPGSTPGRSTKSIDRRYVGFRSQLANISRQVPFTNFYASDGPEFGFDRAMSKDMDNTVGDLRKRSKTITANAANDEVFALAA